MSDTSARLSLFPSSEASMLAPAERADEPDTSVRDFLGFTLAESRYAIALSAILKVIKVPPVTEVPLASEEILGIISVRGQVVTLYDARRLVHTSAVEPSSRSRVLLVNRNQETLGLLVDGVLQVYRLEQDEIEAPGAAGIERQSHVIGIGRPRKVIAESQRSVKTERQAAPFAESINTLTEAPNQGEVLILIDPAALLEEWERP